MVSIGNGEGKTLATLPGFCSGVRFTVAKARDGGLMTEGLRSGAAELNFPATTMARNARGWRLAAMCFPPVAKWRGQRAFTSGKRFAIVGLLSVEISESGKPCMSANRWARPELSASADWSASWSQKNGTISSGVDRLAVPICCHWGDGPGARSVPVRVLCRREVMATASKGSSWRAWTTAANATSLWQGVAATFAFDLTAALREVVKDIVMRLPELAHIRVEQVHIGITRARRRGTGLLARITPMRFPGGKLWARYGNTLCTIQRYWRDGVELLYLLAFCVPRFLDLSFDEKMVNDFARTVPHFPCL
jgi:hypothetical protein